MKVMLGLRNPASLTVLAVSVLSTGSCKGSYTTAPAGSPPIVVTIYKNGTYGTWFGEALDSSVALSTVSVTDAVTEDTLALAYTCCAQALIQGAVAKDASALVYGHFQFDVRLGPAYSGNSFYVGSYVGGASPNTYIVSSSTLSAGHFTHISIPFDSLGFSGSASMKAIANPFQVYGVSKILGATTPALYFNNIRWTSN